MAVGPAYWGSYSGETLEKVMAVLVAQDHPDVRRRTPSSGDGGIDLHRKVDDGYHVTQVKGFTGRLGAAQRRQITESFERLTTNPRLDQPIIEAVFTGPIDLTSGEQEWFDELVDEAPFPCTWEGEVAWNSLAARHPHVIDYFFADGRERVRQAKEALAGAFSSATGDHLTLADVTGHLELLRARLNREDPHFTYDFLVTAVPPSRGDSQMEGAVMMATTSSDDGTFVTVVVRPKHRYALEDAPIQGQLHITVSDPDRGIDIRDELEAFRRFGRGLSVPDGALSVEMSAPGGLGGSVEMGGGLIGPQTLDQLDPMLHRLRMRAVHPEEGLAAELLLETGPATRGEEGVEIAAVDQSGCFEARLQVVLPDQGNPGAASVSFQLRGLEGKAISDVMPAVLLVSKLTQLHEVQIAPQYGTRVLVSGTPAGELPSLDDDDLQYFEDLQTLQDNVPQRVVVPGSLSAEEAFELERTARMLRGEIVVDEWTGTTLNLEPDADRRHVEGVIASSEGALVITGQGQLELDGVKYDVGPSTTVLHSVQLADEQPDNGVAILPGSDNRSTFRQGVPPFDDSST